ncbi:hypothetical protein AALP_AAs61838U000100 [Arabis alpina]|uniref:Uncharacterized protein n=1 Tax=Arabis alpina TaxID=50452 RepID=A0A087G094_ARAAL|nr:hypothetical protein AALP_AAs61838U000100 [Arabis alpina]
MPQTVKNPIRKPPAREVTGGRGTVVDRGRGTVGGRGRGTVGGRGKGGPARGGITEAHERPGTSRLGGHGSASKRKAVLAEDVGGGNGSQQNSFVSVGGGNNGPNKAQSETSVGQGLRQGTGLIRAGVSEVAGSSGSRAREGRSSEHTCSGSMSRTSYPPLQRHPLPLLNQPPPLQASDEEMNNTDEEVDFNIGLELEDEEEDEVAAPNADDAPNAEDQDFD